MRFGKTRTILIIIVVLLLVAALGVWLLGPGWNKPEIRHVLLVSIDTCRADHLSCYGYPLETTPHLDALAAEGVRFENAYSPVPFTLPAHCSMLTGMTPLHHQVMDNYDYILNRDKTTLAEILKKQGFSTAAFVSAFILNYQFGLAQGFDTYEDRFDDTESPAGINERKGGETTRLALNWLDDHHEEKTFLFLHYYDPHHTYDPPRAFAEKFKDAPRLDHVTFDMADDVFGLYAGEIAYVDHCIGEVISRLKELGIYDSTLIVVTADHGEMLGQHGESGHGFFVYQPAIKIPLIVKLPGKAKPRRISESVGTIDIVPTICGMLGLELSHDVQGWDLSRVLQGENADESGRHIYFQSFEATRYGGNPLLGVLNDQYKYIQTTRPELYELPADPAELNNLQPVQVNRGRVMEGKLLEKVEASVRDENAPSQSELSAESLARLESLGYLGGGIEEDLSFDATKDDPKDLIDTHARLSEINSMVHQKQFQQARHACQQLISERPSLYQPYFYLGTISSKQEKHRETVTHLRKVVELKPDDVQAHRGLAEAHEALDEVDEAIAQYIKMLEIRPAYAEGYLNFATLMIEQGEFDVLHKYRTRELLESPAYIKVAITLTEKLIAKGQIRRACEDFRHILELDPASVPALNGLAWIQAASATEEIRNPAKALRLALKACELTNQESPEALNTLAAAYAAAGNFDKAIEISQKAISRAKATDKHPLAGRIAKRMALYKQEQPYRDHSISQR